MKYGFRLEVIATQLPFFLTGVLITLQIALLAMVLALAIGLAVGLGLVSRQPVVRWISRCYLEFFRGVPLLVLIIWFYYGVAILLGITFSAVFAGVTVLSLNYGAYLSETYRAGIQAIERGQTEAALGLGLSRWHTMRYVVLPQAFRIIFPPVINSFVGLLKDSSMVSLIGVFDLMRQTSIAVASTYRPFELYTATALIYLVLTIVFSGLGRLAEGRLRIPGH